MTTTDTTVDTIRQPVEVGLTAVPYLLGVLTLHGAVAASVTVRDGGSPYFPHEVSILVRNGDDPTVSVAALDRAADSLGLDPDHDDQHCYSRRGVTDVYGVRCDVDLFCTRPEPAS